MNLIKQDYANLLGLLSRVETKGIAEAQALIALAQKLEHKVVNWVEGEKAVVTADAKTDVASAAAVVEKAL